MKYLPTLILFLSINIYLNAQNFYTGDNLNYDKIDIEYFLNGKINKHTTYLTTNKKIVKLFSSDGAINEELIIINDSIVSGIEYFTNELLPFLPSPRSFHMGLVGDKSHVRLYRIKNQFFYILNRNGQQKIFFK
tara:strand:- start:327 stop:728 length:402 start_codon:yes stop_codon:yes gene_type:complete